MAARKFTLLNKKKTSDARRMPLGRMILVYVTSFVVAVLVAASLLISISGFTERQKTAQGTNQILDLVDLTRRVVDNKHDYSRDGREDYLMRLSKMKQIQTTITPGKLSMVDNPWDGAIVIYGDNPNQFKLTTTVHKRFCVRIINALIQNPASIGLLQIDTQVDANFWRLIYANDSNHSRVNQNLIEVGCNGVPTVNISFTFTTR